jgi:hypothetical protein
MTTLECGTFAVEKYMGLIHAIIFAVVSMISGYTSWVLGHYATILPDSWNKAAALAVGFVAGLLLTWPICRHLSIMPRMPCFNLQCKTNTEGLDEMYFAINTTTHAHKRELLAASPQTFRYRCTRCGAVYEYDIKSAIITALSEKDEPLVCYRLMWPQFLGNWRLTQLRSSAT